MINTNNWLFGHEPSHFPPFNAFLHQMYYLCLVSNRWIENSEMWNSCPWHTKSF